MEAARLQVVRGEESSLRLVPGERALQVWAPRRLRASRRPPGAAVAEPIVGWPGDSAPRLTLTNRRLIVHGTSAPEVGAHVALERIACVRAEHVSRASRFALEVLLHTPRASATLTLEGLMRRREAFVFTRALADAHRARWQTLPLGGQAEAAVDVMRPRRVRGGLSYLPALHVPLGMTDAIRGPGAPATVPQRMRL